MSWLRGRSAGLGEARAVHPRRGLPRIIRADNGTEVLRAGHADLGASTWRDLASDRARKAQPECLYQVIQQKAARAQRGAIKEGIG